MQIPSLLAMLICDQVIIDAVGGKKTLVGLFETIHAASLPVAQPMGLYAKIADGDGEYKLRVRVTNLKEAEQVIGGLEGTVRFNDPLEAIELALNMPVVFPEEGRYEFQIFMDDFYLGRSTVNVKIRVEEQK